MDFDAAEQELVGLGVLVGERYNSSSALTPLPAYGRVDLTGRYFLTPETEIFARIENISDTDYEDPEGYNAPGLSASGDRSGRACRVSNASPLRCAYACIHMTLQAKRNRSASHAPFAA